MVASLDIFAVRDGRSSWLGAAETLQYALLLAAQNGEGVYFVFSQQTGRKEFYRVGPDKRVQLTASPELEG